jgi:hypothetical protein
LKVNNLPSNPHWKKVLSCTCHGKELELCQHCKYSACEKSIPSNDFKVKEIKKSIDKKTGKIAMVETSRTVKEITIVKGKHDDVIGWFF